MNKRFNGVVPPSADGGAFLPRLKDGGILRRFGEPGAPFPQRIAPHTDDSAPASGRRAASTTAIAPSAVIELARARLARELRNLPPWGSAALLTRLLAQSPSPPGLSHATGMTTPTPSPTMPTMPTMPARPAVAAGALVHYIRQAQRVGASEVAAEVFVALLGRIEGVSAQWARRAVASAPVDPADAPAVREDLRQELTLRLWERIGRGDGEAWELYFHRALVFEQRHVATTFMLRHGYWRDPLTQGPTRGVAILLSRLTATAPAGVSATSVARDLPTIVGHARRRAEAATDPLDIADGYDYFTAADLADLRELVTRLPDRERRAVTLRFWYGASEAEIGAALGGVTTRTVRNFLTRAYAQLRATYQPTVPDQQADATIGHSDQGNVSPQEDRGDQEAMP